MKQIVFLLILMSVFFNGQVLKTNDSLADDLPGFVFKLNIENFKRSVDAKRNDSKKISNLGIVLTLIDGTSQEFMLSENNLTRERVANVLTFDGFSKDKLTKIKLTLSGDKITAMIKSDRGYFIIEPYKTRNGEYRIYESSEMFGGEFKCGANEGEFKHLLSEKPKDPNGIGKSETNFPYGNKMRIFRLAVAATGEFTTAHGGQDAALAEIIAVVNLINLIYESELSLSFQLISATTNKEIIFTDAATDPFTINPTFASAANSQIGFNTLNSNGTLSYASYDIGHTFHIRSSGSSVQGEAGPQPCNSSSKARAWSQWPLLLSKSLITNIIVHEMGHQFNAWHTYNAIGGSSSNSTFCTVGWSSNSAVEPGSGSTIMGYANNCSIPDNQTNTGDNRLNYFHSKSIDQILNTLNTGSTCFSPMNVANTPPVADAGNISIIIPKGTPFKLKGIGTDVENSNLSYTWEQIDVAVNNDKGAFGNTINGIGGYNAVNSATAPLFRSQQSNTTTERYFPKMEFVLNNQNLPPTLEAEALPQVARNMNMRFTVRDNSIIAGGVDSDKVLVIVTNDGPLAISYPNVSGITLASNSNINFTWNVNNTNVIKSNIDILLSSDGGQSFPYTVAANVLNNGSVNAIIPYIPATDKARVKIVGVINPYAEFFDVSDTNFTITSDCAAYSSYISPQTVVIAISGSPSANLNMTAPPAVKDIAYTSKNFVYNVGGSTNNVVVYSNSTMATPFSASTNSITNTFKFRVTASGSYVFSKSPAEFLITSIHSGNPASMANFLTSNSYYNGSNYISTGSTKAVVLNEGVDYYFVNRNFSSPANNTSYTITANGPGSLYETSATPAGYNYTFVAVNNLTEKIQGVSSTANFTSLTQGAYTIKGISYNDAINVSTFVGKSVSELIALNICLNESKNSRVLTLTSSLSAEENRSPGSIKIVPNPVTDILKVYTQEKITHYEIYDLSGRLVETSDRFSDEINFSKFQSGVYLIVLYHNNISIYQSKVIKK